MWWWSCWDERVNRSSHSLKSINRNLIVICWIIHKLVVAVSDAVVHVKVQSHIHTLSDSQTQTSADDQQQKKAEKSVTKDCGRRLICKNYCSGKFMCYFLNWHNWKGDLILAYWTVCIVTVWLDHLSEEENMRLRILRMLIALKTHHHTLVNAVVRL